MQSKATNKDVIRAFVRGQESKTANLKSEHQGDLLVLFSYAEPIAMIFPSGKVIVATRESLHYGSVTTSHHRNMAITAATGCEFTDDLRYVIRQASVQTA